MWKWHSGSAPLETHGENGYAATAPQAGHTCNHLPPPGDGLKTARPVGASPIIGVNLTRIPQGSEGELEPIGKHQHSSPHREGQGQRPHRFQSPGPHFTEDENITLPGQQQHHCPTLTPTCAILPDE